MKNNRLSLNAKQMMVQLGALCLALAVFLVGMVVGRWLLNTQYLNAEAVLDREHRLVQDLEAYVRRYGLKKGHA